MEIPKEKTIKQLPKEDQAEFEKPVKKELEKDKIEIKTKTEISETKNIYAEIPKSVTSNLKGSDTLAKLRAEAKSEMEVSGGTELKSKSHKELDKEILTMNVHELRRLARSNPNFPIKGRDISKANRKILLEYFREIL